MNKKQTKETEEWTNGWPQLMHWFPLKQIDKQMDKQTN